MSDQVLVTGGAGFIGSHLVRRLLDSGRDVRVLDSLEAQVHQSGSGVRDERATYMYGSVLDRQAVKAALQGVGSVVHLAAQVGVGQSMYEISRYVDENCHGTAVLLDAISDVRDEIDALVVASSMSIYGEGQYTCLGCGDTTAAAVRSDAAIRAREWEPRCRTCASSLTPTATTETKRLECSSVYAVTKRDQEELCLVFGRSYGIRTIALRFFNVYGVGQSLSNPYTGVAAIFSGRMLAGTAPLIYEDGLQSRDFVHVSDIVHAIDLALAKDTVGDIAMNVGTGVPITINGVYELLASALAFDLEPERSHKFRHGDVRHCFADITLAREKLGYEPRVAASSGLIEVAEWLRSSGQPVSATADANGELTRRGLVL